MRKKFQKKVDEERIFAIICFVCIGGDFCLLTHIENKPKSVMLLGRD